MILFEEKDGEIITKLLNRERQQQEFQISVDSISKKNG